MSKHDTDLTEHERELFERGKAIFEGTEEDFSYKPSEDKHGVGDYPQIRTDNGTIEEHPLSPDGEPEVHIHRDRIF